MSPLVSAVDLENGIVSEYSPGVPTLDVPAGLGPGKSEVCLDGHGVVHFQASHGEVARLGARLTPVCDRLPLEECFIQADPPERNAHGWQVFRLCAREA